MLETPELPTKCNQTQPDAKVLIELQNLYSAVRICPAPLAEISCLRGFLRLGVLPPERFRLCLLRYLGRSYPRTLCRQACAVLRFGREPELKPPLVTPPRASRISGAGPPEYTPRFCKGEGCAASAPASDHAFMKTRICVFFGRIQYMTGVRM